MPATADEPPGPSRVDIKFSFGNCLDDDNEVKPAPPFGYVPEIAFRNLSWMDYLAGFALPRPGRLAEEPTARSSPCSTMSRTRSSRSSSINGQPARPEDEVWYGQGGKGFGWGTVHHAAGTLRMPYRPRYDAPFASHSVVDEDLRVVGHAAALRLRHVGHAVQFRGQPCPHARRARAAAVEHLG